jgi:glutamine amidotransferase
MTAIIDFGAGNTKSVMNLLDRIQQNYVLTDDSSQILDADRVILPGVGHAKTAMKNLRNKELDKVILQIRKPLLGICLGMQLLFEHTEEGDTECLGIIKGSVRKFSSVGGAKVPHMGWNATTLDPTNPLFQHMSGVSYFYYVHSYHMSNSPASIAECEYILPFDAGVQSNSIYAVQFHPEKSGKLGEQLVRNFINIS